MARWKKTMTARGWTKYLFEDCYSGQCSLQKSSSAEESRVWLGLEGDCPITHPITGESLGMRMHLNQKQAAKLALKLAAFAETGEI